MPRPQRCLCSISPKVQDKTWPSLAALRLVGGFVYTSRTSLWQQTAHHRTAYRRGICLASPQSRMTQQLCLPPDFPVVEVATVDLLERVRYLGTTNLQHLKPCRGSWSGVEKQGCCAEKTSEQLPWSPLMLSGSPTPDSLLPLWCSWH